jgi:hypothetical protein
MIRALTVIGHGTNLLPHYINHYINHVDEINIVVYCSELFPNLESEIREIIKKFNGVKIIKIVRDRVFDWNKVTSLYNLVTNKSPNDWFVISDIDEFHLYSNNLRDIILRCEDNGYQLVRGGFIDRIGPDGEFSELQSDTSIWEQYPNAGFFRYPMSRANPNKICIMKGGVELTSGQHYAKIDGHTTWRWQGWDHPLISPVDSVQVHHFKWDSTAIQRVKDVANLKQDYAFSTEYETMFMALIKTKFKIDIAKKEYMFELGLTEPEFDRYKNWHKLFKTIKSI